MKHVIFDAYGTLFDLSNALEAARTILGDKSDAILARWRTNQLDYAWLSALGDNYIDFETATRMAFQDALSAEGANEAQLVETLSNAFRTVVAYPDAQATLKKLKDEGALTAILSNGTPSMLNAATENAGLDEFLDAVLSVDVVKTYKPAPEAYALGSEEFNTTPEAITFVSSNWWDIVGARNFGFETIWIDRKVASWPSSYALPERSVITLLDVAEL